MTAPITRSPGGTGAVRNRIVHGYLSVDVDALMAPARDDLPELLDAVRAIELPVSP